ncbi:MAG TPA: DNRLRE domain-containing protein, partial [Polyangiaceae bacterium]|nr:DNRLRE domain-containing protein [Polyangiaceae bacterium]
LDYTTKGLVRFDVSTIPSSASVVSAKLDLTVESWNGPQTLLGNFLLTPWSSTASNLGWTSGGAGANWTVPGIGPGDLTGVPFQLGGINTSGYQHKSVALDAASVQAWVSDSTANHGVVLSNQGAGKVLRVFSSEASDLARRPTLSITYQ